MSTDDYETHHIRILEGVEHVRQRPAMYIGGLDDYGLHRLLSGTLDQSLGRAYSGQASELVITLDDEGWIGIRDDSFGVPAICESGDAVTLERAFTKLCAGIRSGLQRRRFVDDYAVLGALSASLTAESRCQGEGHRLSIARGRRVGPIEYLGPCSREGMSLRFLPDPLIFPSNVRIVRRRLIQEISGLTALMPSLSVELRDLRFGRRRVRRFQSPGGLSDLAADLCEAPFDLDLRRASRETVGAGELELDLAIRLQSDPERRFVGFVNADRVDLGEHEEAARLGLEVGLKELAERLNLRPPERLGCVMVLSLKHPAPSYNGGRVMLLNSDVHGPVANLVAATLQAWGEANPGQAWRILHPF